MEKHLRAASAGLLAGMILAASGAAEAQAGGRNPLVGLWVTSSQPCSDESGIRFHADGRYMTGEGNGRWTLRGNRLSLTNWGGGRNVPIEFRRDGTLVIRWDYGREILRRC
jgi:hypothetical protein